MFRKLLERVQPRAGDALGEDMLQPTGCLQIKEPHVKGKSEGPSEGPRLSRPPEPGRQGAKQSVPSEQRDE